MNQEQYEIFYRKCESLVVADAQKCNKYLEDFSEMDYSPKGPDRINMRVEKGQYALESHSRFVEGINASLEALASQEKLKFKKLSPKRVSVPIPSWRKEAE